MPICIQPGFVAENGNSALCALLEQINAHGLVLFACNQFAYVAATCPDAGNEGAISLGGAAFAKIASVASKANLGVQRDASKVAYAERWEVESGECAKNGTRIERLDIRVGSPYGADDPGSTVIASSLALRGHGDIPLYGGDQTPATYGLLKISRYGTRNGLATYANLVGPLAGPVDGHLFLLQEEPGPTIQLQMELAQNLAVLYYPTWTYISDPKTKSAKVPMDCAVCMETVRRIEPINYTSNADGREHSGFDASNIQTCIPHAVNRVAMSGPRAGGGMGDSALGMRDQDILANAIGAIKHLDSALQSALARIEQLEAKVAALEAQ